MDKVGIVLIATTLLTCLLFLTSYKSDPSLSNEFYNYTRKYNKSYSSDSEFAFRFEVYKENLQNAEVLNELNPFAEFGETKFSDMTFEEVFKNQVIKNLQSSASMTYLNENGLESKNHEIKSLLSSTIDWRNYTNAIEDQGGCGSCWAFAATAAFESRRAIRGYPKLNYSEQELVDCVTNSFGCIGGLDSYAYDWLKDFDLCEEKDYPYVAYKNTCKASICHTNATDSGTKFIKHTEIDMLKELKNGPISIGVDATSWMAYKGGILTDCGDSITHAATIVGYGEEDGTTYWLVRNSFGADWGEDGYIRLQYGTNTCNLINRPCFPLFY